MGVSHFQCETPNDLEQPTSVLTSTFSVPGFFFGSAHALAHSRHKRTKGKSERLINGASTSHERLRKVPPLLEDFLSRSGEWIPEGWILGGSSLQNAPTKPQTAGKVHLVGMRLMLDAGLVYTRYRPILKFRNWNLEGKMSRCEAHRATTWWSAGPSK